VATGRADAVMLPSSARAEMAALPKVDTRCTTPSLIPTVNANTVRSFPYARTKARSERKHDHSRSDIQLIQHLDLGSWFGPERALN
jgi:hypothetical protein